MFRDVQHFTASVSAVGSMAASSNARSCVPMVSSAAKVGPCEENMIRTAQSPQSASQEICAWMRNMLDRAVKELHLSGQLIEWTTLAQDVSMTGKVGCQPLQPNPGQLKDIPTKSRSL